MVIMTFVEQRRIILLLIFDHKDYRYHIGWSLINGRIGSPDLKPRLRDPPEYTPQSLSW